MTRRLSDLLRSDSITAINDMADVHVDDNEVPEFDGALTRSEWLCFGGVLAFAVSIVGFLLWVHS